MSYQFVIYRKLAARSVEMQLCDIVEANDHAAGMTLHCQAGNYEASPVWTGKQRKPNRNYYYCEGWDLCIRQATVHEQEEFRLTLRLAYYNQLSESWNIETCNVIRALAVAAGVRELSVDQTDEYLARQAAAQLAFGFTRMTGGPIIPDGPETKKATEVLTA